MLQRDKEVIISVKGTQNNGKGEPSLLELVTEGKYNKNDHEYQVTYNETEITGMQGTTTTISISPKKVVLTRIGAINSQLVFEQGHKHVSYYETVHGAFTVGVSTSLMNVKVDEHGGEIMVEYLLEIDNALSGENDFCMSIREVGENE